VNTYRIRFYKPKTGLKNGVKWIESVLEKGNNGDTFNIRRVTMNINIHFPPIMNMYCHTTLKVEDKVGLDKIKCLVLEKFKEELSRIWGSTIPVYCSSENVVLKLEGATICCKYKLHYLKSEEITFDAYFLNDPYTKSGAPLPDYSVVNKINP
jgi:hypothetical protein